MAYDNESLRRIYDRTRGYCHLCGGKLAFKNYAVDGERGAWEIDHSHPRARGGADHGNNLRAAHIFCNREKSTVSARAFRARNGLTRAPMSEAERDRARTGNALKLGASGAAAGAYFGGPPGAVIGGAVGLVLGYATDPEE